MTLPTTEGKVVDKTNVGYELCLMLQSIEESVLGSSEEYMAWAAIDDACTRLGISTPNNEDAADDKDVEFASVARSAYPAVIEEFEGIVRSFYETSDRLELCKSLRNVSLFY